VLIAFEHPAYVSSLPQVLSILQIRKQQICTLLFSIITINNQTHFKKGSLKYNSSHRLTLGKNWTSWPTVIRRASLGLNQTVVPNVLWEGKGNTVLPRPDSLRFSIVFNLFDRFFAFT